MGQALDDREQFGRGRDDADCRSRSRRDLRVVAFEMLAERIAVRVGRHDGMKQTAVRLLGRHPGANLRKNGIGRFIDVVRQAIEDTQDATLMPFRE